MAVNIFTVANRQNGAAIDKASERKGTRGERTEAMRLLHLSREEWNSLKGPQDRAVKPKTSLEGLQARLDASGSLGGEEAHYGPRRSAWIAPEVKQSLKGELFPGQDLKAYQAVKTPAGPMAPEPRWYTWPGRRPIF